MKVKYLFFLLFATFASFAQVKKVRIKERDVKIKIEPVRIDKQALKYFFHKFEVQNAAWYKFHSFGLNMSEVAFSNWSAGGVNSVSILADAKIRRRYRKARYFWDNELLLNYGINLRDKEQMRKTDDRIVLNSTFGYRTSDVSDWYYSAKFSFNSQFANGYNYPNRENPISKFMSPGYVYLGLGADFSPTKPDLAIFISPLTLKSTFVLNQELADAGKFGVEPAEYIGGNRIKKGKNIQTEVGALLSGTWNTKLYENITMDNRFSFYARYDKNFGNVDIDWESVVNMKVNDYIQARLGVHIKYDDDVKFKERINASGKKQAYSPRVQLKQILGVGFSYKF